MKAIWTAIGLVALVLVGGVLTARADMVDTFQTGYTNGTAITGINGWVDQYGGGGLVATSTGGKDGGWGASASINAWNGSMRLHGAALNAGDRVVADADVYLDTGASFNSNLELVNAASSKYLLLGVSKAGTVEFAAQGATSGNFDLNPSVTIPGTGWYHYQFDWTVGGNITGTIKDPSGATWQTWTQSLAGWDATSDMTYVAASGRYGTEVYDNISVKTIPEPGTIAMSGCALISLLAYAWRKRR
jgi:hypothetical protein